MSKFGNKSFAPSVQQSQGGNGGQSNVDWAALNKHVADTVQESIGCEEGTPSSAIAIVSGIVDYGKHQDPERVEPMEEGDDAAKKWKADMVAKGKAENRDGVFHFQAPPCQEVGFYVDFPSIIVDKGQFFGESNPAPYRVLLGGVFKGEPAQKTKVQGYPSDTKKDANGKSVWMFGDKNRATKLAKSAKLKDLKDGFPQERLLELIGSVMTFNVEVFVNDAGYLQEKISNPSPLMAGIPVPAYDENLLFYVGMNEDNEDQYLKVLTKPVKEYIKTALDFEGSKVQGQLEALEGSSQQQSGGQNQGASEPHKTEKGVTPKPQAEEELMDFDDDQ